MNSVETLDKLYQHCKDRDASDIHLAPGLRPFLRIHGVLEPLNDFEPLTPSDLEHVSTILLQGLKRDALSVTGSVDGATSASDGTRYRFNVFKRQAALAIALRRLEDEFRTLQDLGLPGSLYELCELPDGLIIVAGPTGAGKSTTLATLIDRINQSRACHIVTIEDPIEYQHRSAKGLVNQRQVGQDTASFNDALVASLRQDPDVILVGEIRDLNTIRTAITAAETGHLVFTTVHAGDCVGVIERLVSVFPADEQPGVRRQLSLVLRAVVAQHLMIVDGPAGQKEEKPGQPRKRGRVVTSEIMMVTSAAANLIANGKSAQLYSTLEAGGAMGMQTLEQDLARLHVAGWITEQSGNMMARNPGIFRDRVAHLRKSPPTPTRPQGALR